MARGDYAGAVGRATLTGAARLGASYALQPKHDGCYATAILDGTGRVAEVRARSGKLISPRIHQLAGDVIGAPWSIVVGELEAHTQAGKRAAASNPDGRPRLHLHDCIQVGTQRVAELPYRQRRDALLRSWAQLGTDHPTSADDTGRHHDAAGRFTAQQLAGWERARPVPQWPTSSLDSVWADVVDRQGGEGLVVVALDAPMGRRGSKQKLKPIDTLDCAIIRVSARTVLAHWAGAGLAFVVQRGGQDVQAGELWAVAHEGFHDDGLPKFPRLVRPRCDLV